MKQFPTFVQCRGSRPRTNNRVELVYLANYYSDAELINKLTKAEKQVLHKILGCDNNKSPCCRGIYRDLDYGGLWIPMWDDNTESWCYHYYEEVK